eukprot:NODE_219_length_12440_cov_2.445588.p13 type:complete len:113 gc:universal NODE_219_length_12440_cov_2.445588:918-580(-)
MFLLLCNIYPIFVQINALGIPMRSLEIQSLCKSGNETLYVKTYFDKVLENKDYNICDKHGVKDIANIYLSSKICQFEFKYPVVTIEKCNEIQELSSTNSLSFPFLFVSINVL